MVSTPIGNLEDMTFRAVRVLKEADLIAAEDTRVTLRLMNYFGIHTALTSYHEHNKFKKTRELIEILLKGKNIACVTDAGTPGISDPGQELVSKALEEGIIVVPVPGACAAVSALVCSGQDTRRFCFEAFLPTGKKERDAVLKELRQETRTIVLYEAPHRISRTLEALALALGERSVTIARELTKKHEQILRTTLTEAALLYQDKQPKGEFVLVIAGLCRKKLEEERWKMEKESRTIEELMQILIDEGMDRKEAMREAARERGMTRREVYAALLNSSSEGESVKRP